MVSLVRALQSFQSGDISREQLLAEVDQILEDGRANEAFLLESLEEENTKVPLPDDVHEQVADRIERAAEARKQPDDQAADGAGETDPEQIHTVLATSLFFEGGATADQAEARPCSPEASLPRTDASREPGTVRMKGTGDVLNDRFVLEECIGTGGMSSVYRALDRRKLEADDRNPYVAVKVLNVEFRAHPDSLIALQREAKKSQSLAHPNIVRVYDFDRDGATVYMTMEYLSGKSLAKILRAPGFKGMPEKQAMEILDGIARALRFAHENGIVHADFKPANVILTDDHKIKVIDFGIARAFQRPEDTDMEATRFDPGSLGALTPTYASPEMLEHREPDPRDDVYALACIAYELLTGRHPFGRMQATEARDAELELERRKLNRRQWRALKAALKFDRDKRTPSVVQFLEDLRPEQLVTISFLTMGKVAAVVAVLILGYQYLVAGLPDEPDATAPVEAVPGVMSGEPDGTELAALQVTETDPGVVAAGPAVAEETPSVSEPVVEPERVAKLEAEQPARIAPPAPVELSRTDVENALKEEQCAALRASLDDGVVKVRGFVSRRFNTGSLESRLLALPGAKAVAYDLVRFDPAKCAVVELFGPYWKLGRDGEQGVFIETRQSDNAFVEGQPLVVDISTPGYDTYVNVDYFSLDGNVVHMVPGPRARNNQAPASYKATIGEQGEWIISEPFGSELVTLLLTPLPLFEQMRAEYESQADYLDAVQQRLRLIANDAGYDKIAVDFVVLDTRPKSLLQKLKEQTGD